MSLVTLNEDGTPRDALERSEKGTYGWFACPHTHLGAAGLRISVRGPPGSEADVPQLILHGSGWGTSTEGVTIEGIEKVARNAERRDAWFAPSLTQGAGTREIEFTAELGLEDGRSLGDTVWGLMEIHPLQGRPYVYERRGALRRLLIGRLKLPHAPPSQQTTDVFLDLPDASATETQAPAPWRVELRVRNSDTGETMRPSLLDGERFRVSPAWFKAPYTITVDVWVPADTQGRLRVWPSSLWRGWNGRGALDLVRVGLPDIRRSTRSQQRPDRLRSGRAQQIVMGPGASGSTTSTFWPGPDAPFFWKELGGRLVQIAGRVWVPGDGLRSRVIDIVVVR